MTDKVKEALTLHKQGYNCAQSVILPFCEELGAEPKVISRIAEGFGAGMGGFEHTCGALSGAVMAAGLKYSNPPMSKGNTYKITKDLVEKFNTRCGSTLCPELKGFRDAHKFKHCDECIAVGVELVEEMLK